MIVTIWNSAELLILIEHLFLLKNILSFALKCYYTGHSLPYLSCPYEGLDDIIIMSRFICIDSSHSVLFINKIPNDVNSFCAIYRFKNVVSLKVIFPDQTSTLTKGARATYVQGSSYPLLPGDS